MNPAGHIDGFIGRINYFHRDQENGIIGVLLAHPKDNVAKPILDKIGRYHIRSAKKFNFYLPGYLEDDEWCNYKPYRVDMGLEGLSFCEEWFEEFIQFFERAIFGYKYGEKPELLLFNVESGKIDFSRKIRFKLNEIKIQGVDFDDIFAEIYHTINLLGDLSLTDFKMQFGARAIGRTLIDSFWNATKKLPFLKEFKKNTTGIYF